MLCTAIPDDVGRAFGHSCQHGPPPHSIKVLIPKGANRDIYARLADLRPRSVRFGPRVGQRL